MKSYIRKKQRKKWHDYRSQKIGRTQNRIKKYNPNRVPAHKANLRKPFIRADPVIAPANICIFEKTEDSLRFFSELRKNSNVSKVGRFRFVQIDLQHVIKFDYSAICILMAIIQDLKAKNIMLRGNFPQDNACKNRIIESGLLNFMYNEHGKPFRKATNSDLLFIEKGSGKLTRRDNIGISNTLKKISKYLINEERHLPKLRTILLEICGNSIEWGGTKNKQWLFGVLYEDERVTVTITDVGKGILKTLNKKFKYQLTDLFTLKSKEEILKGAFIKKYGSSTREINRNKGLPSIKNGYDAGVIENLKVLTNNVLLVYDSDIESRVLDNASFRGTLYRWVVTCKSINKAV